MHTYIGLAMQWVQGFGKGGEVEILTVGMHGFTFDIAHAALCKSLYYYRPIESFQLLQFYILCLDSV